MRRRAPIPPLRECAEGCGRKRRTWNRHWACAFCLDVVTGLRPPELEARAAERAALLSTAGPPVPAPFDADQDGIPF